MAAFKLSKINLRAVVLLGIFFLLFLLLISRIGYIQVKKVVNGEPLLVYAEERWTKTKTVAGKRGTIFDRGGSALAEEIPSYTMIAILNENSKNRVEDGRRTAEKLAPIVGKTVEDLEERLSLEKRYQVELGPGTKNLSLEKKREIEALELTGITFLKEPRRYYPKQTFASHVIGYTERDMSTVRMGLENSLNEYLEKKDDGKIEYFSDRKGITLPNIEKMVTFPQNGLDVFLTLDANIQMSLEQVMTQVEERYEPERIMAIVADPKTGQILAMSNRPSFNPNFYEDITNYTNFTVSSRFEPGSTMKIYTLAAAIEDKVYDGSELYQSGSYQIGGRRVRDHNRLGWGKIPFDEGFQRSSNVAMSMLALEKLGPERLYYYLDQFGFRQRTGIDLPNEANSSIADSYLIDAATTAFGQGSAITPIQQVQAATAIANGGKMMRPYIIDRIVNSNTGELVERTDPELVGEPISSNTANQVLELMESVITSPGGTGKPYYIEGYEVAGKTGTAEISDPNGRGYLSGQGQYIYSFMGMAPKSDPKLIVYVAVDRPKITIYEQGSEPVAEIFTTVMKHSLQYLNISPKANSQSTSITGEGILLGDVIGKSVEVAKATLMEAGLDVHVIGSGNKIEAQIPVSKTRLLQGEKVLIVTDGSHYSMPNIEGWSLRDVMKLAEILDLNANLVGSGFVKSQSVSPNSEIRKGDYLAIELALPDFHEEENNDSSEAETENSTETLMMD